MNILSATPRARIRVGAQREIRQNPSLTYGSQKQATGNSSKENFMGGEERQASRLQVLAN